MAIAFGTAGSAANGSTTLSPGLPASTAAGDFLLLQVVNKYPTNGPVTPTGWTLGLQVSAGLGASGPNSGNVYVSVYHRTADGTASDTPSVSIPSGNSSCARVFRFTTTAGTTLAAAYTSGSQTTPSVSWSVTGAADPGVTAGDMVAALTGVNGSSYTAVATHALSQTGITFGSVTERWDLVVLNGDDCGAWTATCVVSSGTSSAAPVYTAVSSTGVGDPAGATVFVRFRAISNSGASSVTLDAITSTGAGTVTTPATSTAPTTIPARPLPRHSLPVRALPKRSLRYIS